MKRTLDAHKPRQDPRLQKGSDIKCHLIPWFGPLTLNQIYPAGVREWVTWMRKELGVSPANLTKTMSPLSAIFTTALNDGLIYLHPCKGIKLPPVPDAEKEILTVEEFDAVFLEIADLEMQVLLETDIETGFSWGELNELRAKDWHSTERTFKVSRVVIKVRPTLDPDGLSFRVKPYAKGKKPLGSKSPKPLRRRSTATLRSPASPETTSSSPTSRPKNPPTGRPRHPRLQTTREEGPQPRRPRPRLVIPLPHLVPRTRSGRHQNPNPSPGPPSHPHLLAPSRGRRPRIGSRPRKPQEHRHHGQVRPQTQGQQRQERQRPPEHPQRHHQDPRPTPTCGPARHAP